MDDRELIEHHGGSTKLAELLGYTVQRVDNWKRRGIPPAEKLAHPDLFLGNEKQKSKSAVAA